MRRHMHMHVHIHIHMLKLAVPGRVLHLTVCLDPERAEDGDQGHERNAILDRPADKRGHGHVEARIASPVEGEG
jgi:hypothetical protein